MRKILLIIIFLFTNIFSQDILITKKGTEYKGEFINKTDNSISFKAVGMLNAQNIQIETIESLILDDGTVVINRGYFIEDSESLENGKKLNITAIGGSLIGLSGMILYLNNQRTIDEEITLDELEEFVDRTKSNSDLAFIFLTLGGFLIAIDNFN